MSLRGGGGRRTRVPGLTLLLAAVVLLGFGCSPEGDVVAGAETDRAPTTGQEPAEQVEAEETGRDRASSDSGSGVMVGWRLGLDPIGEPPPPPPGTLTLTACRWLGPGRWQADLDWQSDPAPTPDQPVTAAIGVVYALSADTDDDAGREQEGAGGAPFGVEVGRAELVGNGGFTVAMSGSAGPPVGAAEGWWMLRPEFQAPPTGRCDALLIGPDTGDPDYETATDLTIVPTPLPDPPGDRAGDDPDETTETIEDLGALVPLDATWTEHPMAALALVAANDDLPVDRFFLAGGETIRGIEVQFVGPCLLVSISYAPETMVYQHRDCEPGSVPDRIVGDAIDDEEWTVVVDGPPAFVEAVKPVDFLGAVDPADAPRLDPELASGLGLGGRAAGEPGGDDADPTTGAWALLDSFDWREATIEVWFDSAQDACCVVYEVESGDFSGGSTGQACRDWAVSLHDDGTNGFFLVVATGGQWAEFVVDGEPIGVPLRPTRHDGILAAVVDAPFDYSAQVDHLSRLRVYEPNGSRSPCIQE